jgi:hypothetical protein
VLLRHRDNFTLLSIIIIISSSSSSSRLRPGRPRGRNSSPNRVKNFLFFMSSRQTLGFTQPPIQWVPGVKRPAREADHSPPDSSEVKKMWIYTSTPPYVSQGHSEGIRPRLHTGTAGPCRKHSIHTVAWRGHIENTFTVMLRGACVGTYLLSRCLAMFWSNPFYYYYYLQALIALWSRWSMCYQQEGTSRERSFTQMRSMVGGNFDALDCTGEKKINR